MDDEELREVLRDLKKRVDKLESFRWMIVGALGVIVVLIIPVIIYR